MASSKRSRAATIAGAILGSAAGIAAGVTAGVTAQRLLVRRYKHAAATDPYGEEPFGQLPVDETRTVATDEGIKLHVEINGPRAAGLTAVLVHGFCLDMGTFHFQRKALIGLGGTRVVCYDQPGHGRSGHLDTGEYTLDMLGAMLRKVVIECAADGPVALVGHSMGGMAIMAMADHWPEMFGPTGPVAGVSLISTTAGDLGGVGFGLPQLLVRFRRPLLPFVSSVGWITAGMIDRARAASTDLAWMLTLRYGFGSARPHSPALVSYVERMNSATRTEAVARYLRTLYLHDRVLALGAFAAVPVLVICGDEDQLTPLDHSRAICAALPKAELVVVPKGGHVALLEHSDVVNAALIPFLTALAR